MWNSKVERVWGRSNRIERFETYLCCCGGYFFPSGHPCSHPSAEQWQWGRSSTVSWAYDWGSEKQSAGGENAPVSVHCGIPSILGLFCTHLWPPVLLSSFSPMKIHSHFPHKPIILIGWNTGALVACHVSNFYLIWRLFWDGIPLMIATIESFTMFQALC